MDTFEASDWLFERVSTSEHRSATGEGASGHIRVKLRNVPSCRCIVAELPALKWHWERDEPGSAVLSSYTTFKGLRAELRRNGTVWVVGQRVSSAGGGEETEPIKRKIGAWPKIAASGREG